VDKKIKVLSGGEKARVALAKTIVSKANVLLLDEPTNHLDIHSVELLADALNKYEGSIILVSHDRYFISKVANKIWEIIDHEVKEFKGTYAEWSDWNERMAAKAKAEGSSNKQAESSKPKAENKPQPVSHKPQSDANKNELAKVKKQFEKLEAELSTLTEKKKTLEAKLGDSAIYSDKNKYQQAEKDYQQAANQHAKLQAEYEKIFEEMMSLEG
jgi:ATP-binding cassette subfamily F protein 3